MRSVLKMVVVLLIVSASLYGDVNRFGASALLVENLKKAENLIKHVNRIYGYINEFIMINGYSSSQTISKADLELAFGLDSNSSWLNYSENSAFDFNTTVSTSNGIASPTMEYEVTFSNLFPANLDPRIYQALRDNRHLHPNAEVNVDLDITIRLHRTTTKFVEKVDRVDSALAEVSPSQSMMTTKLWYQPDGEGDFHVYHYDGGAWQYLDIARHVSNPSEIFLGPNMVIRDKLEVGVGDKVYVRLNTDDTRPYIYDGAAWHMINGYDGDGELSVAIRCHTQTIGTIRYKETAPPTFEYCADNGGSPTWKTLDLSH
jgi:hypothetical protein